MDPEMPFQALGRTGSRPTIIKDHDGRVADPLVGRSHYQVRMTTIISARYAIVSISSINGLGVDARHCADIVACA